MDTRRTLHDRLTIEFGDAAFADEVVGRVGDETVAAVNAACGGAIDTSPMLSYRSPEMSGDRIDAVIAFSYGYRLAPGSTRHHDGIPPMGALVPGPVNELLAGSIAAFVTVRPMPVIAQWEIARVLGRLGTADVVSIEPDVSNDGSATYLSTAGVIDKGLTLAAADDHRPTCVGVIAHRDHAPRCVATVRARGIDAGTVTGLELPDVYDPHSGQRWTRDRATWIATDLFARTQLADSTDWMPPR